jgi:plastocyanin
MALRRQRVAALAAALVLLGTVATAGCSSSGSKTKAAAGSSTTSTTAKVANLGANVEIIDFAFQAPTVTVKVGQAVVWKNDGQTAHTVLDTSPQHAFNSPNIDPGATFDETFHTAGTYAYVCSIHPDRMKGTIIVTPATP